MPPLGFHQAPGGGQLIVLLLQFFHGYSQFFDGSRKFLQGFGQKGLLAGRTQRPSIELVKSPAGDFQFLPRLISLAIVAISLPSESGRGNYSVFFS